MLSITKLSVLLVAGLATVAPAATIYSLQTAGAAQKINDGHFLQDSGTVSGTGRIDSFVRLQTNRSVEEGYNTSARKLEMDQNSSPNFTRDLLLSEVPRVNYLGGVYREFLLDINQSSAKGGSILDLERLEVYVSSVAGVSKYADLGIPVWSLDGAGDATVRLDARLSSGSGKADAFVLLPDAAFAGYKPSSYVYLYSKFSGNTGGFEEWAVVSGGHYAAWADLQPAEAGGLPVPIPSAAGMGLLGMAGLLLRRDR